jgi:hypothetical protein
MSYKNLAEINYVGGILKLLQNNPSRFAILAITFESTPDNMKIYMRRWLKQKSKEFPNIMFAYFCADKNDVKTSNLDLISKDIGGYPYVYHIVDTKKILVKVENVDVESINSSFDTVKHYYIKDLQEHKDDEISDNECDNSEYTKKSSTVIVNNEIDGLNKMDTNKPVVFEQKQPVDKKLEQVKLLEKMQIMDIHSKKFMEKFTKDLKKRKKSKED